MEKYLQPIKYFLEKNKEDLDETEFICLQYEITDQMKADKIGFEAVKSILKLMEENPLLEFGTPGPFTHFIENFYTEKQQDYINLVKQSVAEKPTIHTVWLLHRIINRSENEKATELIEILKSISKNTEIQQEIRDFAINFLEYQEKND